MADSESLMDRISDFVFPARKPLRKAAADSTGRSDSTGAGAGADTSSGREAGSSVRDAIAATARQAPVRPDPPARSKKRAAGKQR